MVHLLHVEMVALVRELLAKFMKPACIPLTAKELVKVHSSHHSFDFTFTFSRKHTYSDFMLYIAGLALYCFYQCWASYLENVVS